jgi:EPS-associated MarR family transcriptional regulator
LKNEELTLTILRSVDEIDNQKSFAKKLGCSVGKTNYILKALMQKGLIKAENFISSQNKKKYRYLLTEEGIKEKVKLTKKFIERKKAEYEELQRELEGMM